MSAAFDLNFHHPACHNERVKVLIKKFEIKLQKAHGERNEIIDREDSGETLNYVDLRKASDLLLTIQDHSRTLGQLNLIILPEEN